MIVNLDWSLLNKQINKIVDRLVQCTTAKYIWLTFELIILFLSFWVYYTFNNNYYLNKTFITAKIMKYIRPRGKKLF